ncbi:MAG: hypothetical protein ACQEVT_02510 [Pseudomonadota bacterium]|uniref:hypothetical protein n=1 Tax=Roseovarius TaxID=74030 RepID=UPI0022A76849|nr:hypothetical protein [Roseovarius sp. EGI FJ00037]MCZ0811330.1 hypothetical protein [Roseovarius sp. EGI FJ00037]
MSKTKRIAMAGGTFICALGAGFIVQSMAGTPDQVAASPVELSVANTDEDAPLPVTNIVSTSAPVPPQFAPQPAPLPSAPVARAEIVPAAFDERPVTALPAEEPAPAFSCETLLEAKPVAAAMVELTLNAPCMANERFTLHHHGMMFTQATDEDGQKRLVVPALTQSAVYMVSFTNGEGAVASAVVTSTDYYDRVVVQWQGQSGLQIHALEYGAGYGDEGHVWAEAPRDMAAAAQGEGGFVTRHGLNGLGKAQMAEVYTFPVGLTEREGDVVLSVEAEVTQQNCGRDIEAQTIEISAGGKPLVQDLVLALPGCDATGDFLVLKNLVNDLKIARK